MAPSERIRIACPACKGSGLIDDEFRRSCRTCGGTGRDAAAEAMLAPIAVRLSELSAFHRAKGNIFDREWHTRWAADLDALRDLLTDHE